MVPKKTTPKKSGSATKGTTKRAHAPRESRAAIPKSGRGIEKRQKKPEATALDAAPSLAERVHVEREQIFKAVSIVECCRCATATLLEVSDTEYMIPAFEAICALLNDSAEELEQIAFACEKTR